MQSKYHRIVAVSVTALLVFGSTVVAQPGSGALQQRIIKADLLKPQGRFSNVYDLCIGAGRASEGLRADWQQQLSFIKKELGFKYIRFHGLLNDEMQVYKENKEGQPAYNWQYVDKLYDFLLGIGIRPFVELGFMPPDLASGTKTVFWWKGNVTPPKSYEKWSDLVTALVKHWEERYGRPELEKWYFEIWNEPDLGGFFSGTQEEYFKLYQVSVAAIQSVSKTYRVGGPATARNGWISPFLKFCADNKVPLDFVSTHSYNTKSVLDEFGINKRRLVAKDYLPEAVKKVRRMIDSTIFKNTELHYTEFNSSPSSRDPIHDTHQNAAWLLTTLKHTGTVAHSMSYWTFTDIFEEAGPGMTSFHGGFGLLNLQGIPKPTFHAYKFMSELGKTELANTDSSSWICRNEKGIQVLFWNLYMPFNDTTTFDEIYFRKNIPAEEEGTVSISIDHVPNGKYSMSVYKVGYHFNDPYSAYLEMGAPANLSIKQEAELREISSGKPVEKKQITITNGKFESRYSVKKNDIIFIKLDRI
ncbi:MAG TPA: glycoside hydrolase [Chitinophagaceae bacterium]|jgi:xylan 1,4-beta-xylosidase|nr:glycoside hydrolase [Chitinophagaceae bacterium]